MHPELSTAASLQIPDIKVYALLVQAQAVGEAARAAAIHQDASDPEQTKTVTRRFLAEQVNINIAEELHISAGIMSC